jgi:D-alanyl-D-alanine carboxypeptidase
VPHSLRAGLAVALVFLVGAGAAAAATPARKADTALDRALQKLVTMPGGPPGVIAVVQRGDELRIHRAGYGDVAAKRRPRASDHMRIASVAKAFSGATALSLVQKGVLSLDDTIAKRLPSLPAAWGAVTLRQLLNHTSGVPDFLNSRAFQEALSASLTVAPPPEKLLDTIAGDPLEFAPGSKYAYSNSDNIVVGLMVQAATGKSYEQELQEQVFGPLGLTETSLPAGPELPPPFIHGYDREGNGPPEDLSEVFAAGWAWASGGIVSTPLELNRFVRGYVGGALFGADVQGQQRQFVAGGQSGPPGPGTNAAGLALFRYQTRCGTVYGHTGNTFGFTQFIAASPDGKRSVTVSINLQRTETSKGQALAVFKALRRTEVLAVCAALAGS